MDLGPLIELLAPRSGERILDVGAGKGEVTDRVMGASNGAEVYAVEPNAKRVDLMRRNHPAIRSTVGGAEKLPFPDSYFDKVYTTMALHHFSDLDAALREVARVLKQGGSFVVLEVEPGAGLGRMFRLFGRMMGERMNITTKDQLVARLDGAGGLKVVGSVRNGSRYLVKLVRA